MSQSDTVFEKHLKISSDSIPVVDLLAETTGFSKQRIKQIMQKGAVWVTLASRSQKNAQRLRRANKSLHRGDELHLYYDEKVLAEEPPVPGLIADEGDYSVWYKPYGLRSQGSKWSDHCTISRWVETHLEPQRPAFIVHRLDRAATGLIVIAHKKSTAALLSAKFANREMVKRYRAVVHGKFPDRPQPFMISQPIDGRRAVSHATRLEYDAAQDRSLVEVKIETGRKHQIRKHLAGAGYPLVGDRLHGNVKVDIDVKESDQENLQLTACFLAFRIAGDGAAESKKEYRLGDEYIVSLSRK